MNLADKPGIYNNFSGQIKWKSISCQVRNADFEILEKDDENGKEIIFSDAVFVSGGVGHCIIKNCLNLGCNFFYSDIDYMINKGLTIFACNWRDGIFDGGVFKYGRWFDGIWIKGEWDDGKNSMGKKMELTPDKW